MVLIREGLLSSLWVLFGTYLTAVDGSKEEVERHLEKGKELLAKGQFADALTHYHAAIDLDPENYLALYRRATCFLAMGRTRAALPDLEEVVRLAPDFTAARMQRAKVFLRQGQLSKAAKDFKHVLSKDPNNSEAQQGLESLKQAEEYKEEALTFLSEDDFDAGLPPLSKAIEVCPWDGDLRLKRAESYEGIGDIANAISDYRAVTKLIQNTIPIYLKLSLLYYTRGDYEESLTEIRECLKLDPDEKQCFAHYKKAKKVQKQMEAMKEAANGEDWLDCLERAEAVLKSEPRELGIRNQVDVYQCRCNSKAGHINEALQICTIVLETDPGNANSLCDRAEAHQMDENFDEAISDFQKAIEIDENNRRAQEGLKRAQKQQKQAQRKDYYKILGVKRNADKRQIMKAYRKLAQKWHPDNFSDETEKKKAQEKFIDLAAAKEVLTDPEKRQMFDNGEDPLDPEQQQQRNHPFYGFNPFGGGGGFHSFKFHFQ